LSGQWGSEDRRLNPMVSNINPEPDPDDLTIQQCLEQTLENFKDGVVPMSDGNKPTKICIMFLDDSEGRFETKVLCGSDVEPMMCSTLVSLMELYKYKCLRSMNDKPGED